MNINVTDRAGSDSEGPQTPPIEAAGKTSAISSKITSILSASYADIELRDALETLDARQLKNNADTPRNLRRDVQREIIECNGEVVQDFGQVALQLKSVGTALEKLRNTCDEIGKHVALARMETAPMLDEANNLMAQKAQVDTKQNILSAFNTHFVLDDSEVAALTSSTEPVDDNFFQTMVKAKRIHKDSQVLLASENQRLGLEILDQSSKYLNAGYQKLYRWIQREFKELDLENPRISSSVRRALRVLAEKPALFQNCLDAFAEAREESLLDAFHTALTGSDRHTGQQRPIEFSAHEPLRYVGDMLAWSHSTTVSEREALEGLFISDGDEISKGIEEGLESEPWSRGDNDEKFDGKKALRQLIDRSLAGVAQLLQQRIEQVIQSHNDSVLSYKVANLVAFYKNIFRKLIDDSGFLEALSDMESAALDQFRADMRHQKLAVDTEHTSVPSDLSAPEFLSTALESLQALLKSYETSVASNHAAAESSLELLLAEALHPFLEHCDDLARTLPDPSSTMFSVNCLLEARSSLANFPFAAAEAAAVTAKLDARCAALAAQQHAFLLDASGLRVLLDAVAPLQAAEGAAAAASLAALPAFAPAALAAVSERLDAFLPSALMDASLRLKAVRHGSLARDATADAAERFCADFDVVEQMILAADAAAAAEAEEEERGGDDEAGADGESVGDAGTVALRDVFPRTGEEIRILLT